MLDSMVKDYEGQLKFCEVAISQKLERLLITRELMCHADKERVHDAGTPWWRLWRSIDSTNDGHGQLGYWIRKGVEESLTVVSCF